MYIEDLKKDFYEFLTGKRISLMVHYDIDSLCTLRILQSLLKHNQTVYTLSVIQYVSDLESAFREQCDDVKFFVLINCGGTRDLVELLEPEEDVVFFILDSHRPLHVCNVYSREQIRIVCALDNDVDVPEYHTVFSNESDDEEEDQSENSESESEEQSSKRRRLGEEEILKRRERRLWESKRAEILYEYTKYCYHAKASALYMFELAWKLSRDDKDILWYAIVSVTEQLMFEKIENTLYVLETANLQAHATRLHNRSNNADDSTSVKIKFERDLKLVLYRHWSVESSLKHSMYTACKLKLWSIRGDARLNELLAEMGFPLVQSRQNYLAMDLQLKQEFLGAIEKLSERYDLTDIIYTTFILSYGYRNKYCAADVVYGMLSLLESSNADKNPEECFQLALDCLSRSNRSVLNAALEKSKLLTISLFKTVQSALDMKKIVSAGPFIYYIVQEGSLDWHIYSHLHNLHMLAQFILRAYVAMSRNRNASRLPLIVSAPKNMESGICVILGIPPLASGSNKNFLGKAFENAADQINCEISCNYFDTAYIDISIRNRTRFLDAVTALLG